jgi:hypothetical protein
MINPYDKSKEICINCINWDGDNSGMEGLCEKNADNVKLLTSRLEECGNFINLHLDINLDGTD